MTSPDIVAIILAGGASSRFGSDKLAALLEGRPLLHHALEAVGTVSGSIVIVIAPEAPVPSVPEGPGSRVVIARDVATHGGPLAGLAAGLAAMLPATSWEAGWDGIVLVVGGDMPSLVPAVLRLLAITLAADPSLVVMTLAASGPAPLPMALRPNAARAAIDAILTSGGRRSLLALADAVPSDTLPEEAWRAIDPGGATLRDVDGPADLAGG